MTYRTIKVYLHTAFIQECDKHMAFEYFDWLHQKVNEKKKRKTARYFCNHLLKIYKEKRKSKMVRDTHDYAS